jgi:hypothetical protein
MAGRKKESFERGRVEFKAPPEWVERATKEAERAGFGNLSAFIRFVVTQYLDNADVGRAQTEAGRRRKGE